MSTPTPTAPSPDLSPSESLAAQKAVERLLTMRHLFAAAGLRPMPGETISIPLEEMEALALAAAPALGIPDEEIALGTWTGPMERVYAEGEPVIGDR